MQRASSAAAAALVLAIAVAGCTGSAGSSGDRSPTLTTDPAGRASTTTAVTATTSATNPPAPTSTPSSSTTSSSTTTTSAPPAARAAVDRLVVRTDPDGGAPPYRRAEFGDGWAYDPATGCNTRERVLIAESLVPATVDDRCHPTAGRWRSIYDGLTTDDPADLQVDHVVALADAWRSGAWRWTAAQREVFANDVVHPEALAAVSGRSNQSKGDDAPDAWLPDDRGGWCDYADAWVAIKARWNLSVTPAEKSALVRVLEGCPAGP